MSMQPFVYNSQASRVVFGVGSLSYLTREIEALGARRALVLSTPEQRRSAEQVADAAHERTAQATQQAVCGNTSTAHAKPPPRPPIPIPANVPPRPIRPDDTPPLIALASPESRLPPTPPPDAPPSEPNSPENIDP